ncbi:hypothetical protein CS0771_51230 [Catellatospora sp. IY07-71]|nr:hypothetical protein CS0771_51230 [Catellatospora sp. IY07-71]
MIYDGLSDYEFAFPGPLRDKLTGAVLAGHKTSTTGLLIGYEHDAEPLPQAGQRSTMIGSAGQPLAILELTEVRLVPLGEVDLAHAADEGEGYPSVAGWRAAHERFWHSDQMRGYLGDPGFTVDDDTVAVAERFRVASVIPGAQAVNAALAAEAAALVAGLRAVPEAALDRPTCCPPWTVRDEFAHAAIAVSRTLEMLDAAPPPGPPVDTARYYAPDHRFAPQADRARVDLAAEFAAARSGPELIDWFEQQAEQVTDRVGASPERLVTTRHGDPMRLTDFQVTRVVELAVHGLDLADALGVAPWLTEHAAAVVEGLLFGLSAPAARAALGVDAAGLLRRATGRVAPTGAERERLDGLGVTWLTLG